MIVGTTVTLVTVLCARRSNFRLLKSLAVGGRGAVPQPNGDVVSPFHALRSLAHSVADPYRLG